MGAVVQQRIRVPSKQSLEFFMANWNKIQLPVVNGEYTLPDPSKVMTIERDKVSHGIMGIHTETYDPKTETVVADIVFTGPKSDKAQDEFVRGDIRFFPRCVRVIPPGGTKKDGFDSIITWDLAHRPVDPDGALKARIKQERAVMRAEENAKDRAMEEAKKKLRK